MEFIFLDNGLISKGEHSYALVRKAAEVLARRGIAVRIFGCKGLDPAIAAELGAAAHFRRSLYESEAPTPNERRLRSLIGFLRRRPIEKSLPSERTSWKILNASFEEDLAALPADVARPDNLIIVPAASQNQIFGLIRWMRAKPPSRRPRVVCQLMFAPSWVPWGRTSQRGERLYRKAFALARPLMGRSLFFTAENKAIAQLYRARFGIEAQILPIPFGAARKPAASSGLRPRLGFFGYSKCDKGFHLLPGAIRLCQTAGLAADFTIQIQHGGWDPETAAAERALRALPGPDLIEGVLDGGAYLAQTDKIDVMLLPYDPIAFGLRGSGIFTESVAAGRPVIASEGTFAARSIAIGEAEGEVFAPYDEAQLAAAILRLAPRLNASKERAASLAETFARRHSPETYIDVLLDHAKK